MIVTKKIIIFIFFVYCVLCHSAYAKKLVIAHRGASGYLPEHTYSGAVMAFVSGADFLELDVVMTKDGHLIVMHDLTLNATTNVKEIFPEKKNRKGKYQVIDFTLNEIKLLKVHERSSMSGKNAAFPQRFPIDYQLFEIPTLDNMINLVKGLSKSSGRKMGLYIEIKAPEFHSKHNKDPALKLLKLLNHHGFQEATDPVFIQSFDSKTLKKLRYQHKTRLRLIQLIGENRWRLSDTDFTYLKSEKGLNDVSEYADGIGPWMNQLVLGVDLSGNFQITNLVKNARRKDLLIHAYTFRADRLPDYVSNFDELLDIFLNEVGVDGIFTDFPDLVVSYLERNPAN
tara:strand:+ start:266 stop:1288 length:1023 start_codon:yes stop_codon:yes gene_type:complete